MSHCLQVCGKKIACYLLRTAFKLSSASSSNLSRLAVKFSLVKDLSHYRGRLD